ncbi:prevent-host-death family protein [Oscillochloris trichoides DG-6]|uniref:Antitoxin n=1 Tax=Oscillochloris trichoides DG-6 TaxID=765420 RepID=E1IG18_9CHLR|nr:type II toxin-antitoxin system Phd/YefM family antitoxin [Oscillochloris trichoides]EFO79907.1 prevent-host-death family protein [Oscillochloris trichoides DG-6]
MAEQKKYTLDVDLKQGVVPISKAASSLASLIKRSRAQHQPIIVTQKGYPTGVILDVELFSALRKLADQIEGFEDDVEVVEEVVEN